MQGDDGLLLTTSHLVNLLFQCSVALLCGLMQCTELTFQQCYSLRVELRQVALVDQSRVTAFISLTKRSQQVNVLTFGDLAHAAESVLEGLGKGSTQVNPQLLDTLQQALDHLNKMLAEVGAGRSPASASSDSRMLRSGR